MKRTIHAWFLVLTALGLSACSGEQSGSEPDLASLTSSLTNRNLIIGEEAETFTLAERMAHHGVPAVSVAYFDSGEIVWAEAWGLKDATTGEPVTTETLFQASGLSKPVASLGMLTMVEEGLLDLDTDINQYLTSWSLPLNKLMDIQAVTLRLVASHSAGLTVKGFTGYPVGTQLPTTLQVLDGIPPANNEPLLVDTTPGSTSRFSGGGFVAMQLLMEDVSGVPFQQLMRKRVFDPLGMTESTFEQPLPAARSDQAATAHDSNGEPLDGRFHVYPELAAAGLWTTPSDLARLVLEVQRAFAGETGRLLSPELAEQVLTAQLTSKGIGFSLLVEFREVTALLERGANAGFFAQWFALTTGGGMVIMTNGVNGGALASEILMAAGRVYGWSQWQPKPKKLYELSEAELAKFVGQYQITHPLNARVIVEPADRGLNVEVEGLARATDYYPDGKVSFFDLAGGSVRFEVDDDDRSVAALFGGIRAERVE